MEKVAVGDGDGCWEWTACVSASGYSRFNIDGRSLYGHRFVYEVTRGAIPTGMVIDHLCRNTRCVNPDHLEVVTPRENVQRGRCMERASHCTRGHEFSEENTRVWGGKRFCRTCDRSRGREQARLLRARARAFNELIAHLDSGCGCATCIALLRAIETLEAS